MKIKQIEAILKTQKTIIVSETKECQWLSNGEACYPVYNLPKLTRENIFTMFDINESKWDKFYFKEQELPSHINFSDEDEAELMVEQSKIEFNVSGRTLVLLKTSQGMVFINARYLRPFSDLVDGFELYERTSKAGTPYIAVKSGFVLLGVILPYDLINEKFIVELEDILNFSKMSLFNKQSKMTEESTAEQLKL